jgi:hypothetical protein
MLFNITRAVNFILDENKNHYFRAIKLFKLHVAIRLANGRPEESKRTAPANSFSATALLVRVPKKQMRDAELFATIKFLEYIETQLKEEYGTVSLNILANNKDWNKLFDKQFVRFGGFRRARHLPGARIFDKTISRLKKQTQRIAKLTDFVLRFEPNQRKKKGASGITKAKEMVAELQYLDVGCKQRTLEEYWPKYEPIAAFLPLIVLKKYPAWPLKISKTQFANWLLKRIDDRAELLSFFAEYNANVLRLREHGCDLQTLETRVELPNVEVRFDPLPEKLLEKLGET